MAKKVKKASRPSGRAPSSHAKKATKKPAKAKPPINPPKKAKLEVQAAGEQAVINTMEVARRATRMKASADRQARLAEFKAKHGAQARGMRLGPGGELRILAEGDSWFDYPKILNTGGGVVPHLEDISGFDILNMAHYGDEVRGMMALEQRQRLESILSDRSLGTFDILMFSGGGNDVVGDPMVLWIRAAEPGMTAADAIDKDRFEDIIDLVEIGYRDLIAIRDALSPQTHIITHSYDVPQPNGKGVCGVGPWLKPSLDYRGWTDPRDQFEIVREMLGRFDQMQEEIAANTTRFTHVHTQGMLDPRTEWHNELHPNRAGFNKVALAFNNALAEIMPTRFRRR